MSTAVQAPPAQNKQLTIRERLQQPAMIAELGKAMPRHCKPDRMARIALTAITRVPKLAECDQASFFKCLLDLSQWGLEPDGRRAHLIPFNNKKRNCVECQLIIDYKGYVELAYNSGVVLNIHADVVYKGDLFEYNLGKVVQHVPHFLRTDADKPADRGDVLAAYCIVELKGGTVKTEIMSKADVESIRRRSRAAGDGPWVTDWNEMAKKSAFRRATKWLPLSAEIRDAMDSDQDKIEFDAPTEPDKTIGDITALLTQSTGGDEDTIDSNSTGEAESQQQLPAEQPKQSTKKKKSIHPPTVPTILAEYARQINELANDATNTTHVERIWKQHIESNGSLSTEEFEAGTALRDWKLEKINEKSGKQQTLLDQ